MRRALINLFSILLLTVWLGTSLAHAQGPRRRPGKLLTLKTTAVLKGLRPGFLFVAAENGQNWVVSVPKRPEQILYHASASPAWLQRGMVVRFQATLDKRLSAQKEIDDLTVITTRPGVELGITGESEPDERANLLVSEKEATQKKRPTKGPATFYCLVVGRLLGNKGKTMMVAAGRKIVHADLAPTAKVAVELNDLRLAQPGDKVEFSARYYEGAKGQAQGQQVTVTAAKPLEAVSKKIPRRGRSRRNKDSQKVTRQDGVPAIEVEKDNKRP